jgi:hypothetical protein
MSVGRQSVVLLDTGFDWPEIVFIGSHEECGEFIRDVLGPALEVEGDEAINYTTVARVEVTDALEFRRKELDDS